MCAALDNTANKKKMKQKSVLFGYLNRIVSPSNKTLLKTDAMPLDNENIQIRSNDNESNNENTIQHLNTIPSRIDPFEHAHSMQMIQNNLNQANQNVTVIESQQNLNFNNITGLQIGNTFHVSSSRKNSHSRSNENKRNSRMKKSLIELMNSEELIEMQIIRLAARFMGENWRMVFRDLHISDPEISQIKEQYFHISVEEVIYQLLLRWQRCSTDPSLGKLSTALWTNENHKCIAELKKYLKQKKSQAETCDRESD